MIFVDLRVYEIAPKGNLGVAESKVVYPLLSVCISTEAGINEWRIEGRKIMISLGLDNHV